MTIMKIYEFYQYCQHDSLPIAVISQDRGEISPHSCITSVCLFEKAILKRFSHTRNFFIFSENDDCLIKNFSKYLINWTSIKHGYFWSGLRGRRQEAYISRDIVIQYHDK